MSRTEYPWLSLLAGAFLAGIYCLPFVLAPDFLTDEKIRELLRLTGRVSFFLFLVPFLARPLHVLTNSAWSNWMVRRRGNFGLAFAGNHVVHVVFIVLLYQISDLPPVETWVLVGGLFGLFYLTTMVVLTFQAPIRLVGARATKYIHRFILYYLIFIFMYDFVFKEPFGTYPILTTIWFVAVGIRIVAWIYKRQRTISGRNANAAA